MAMTLPTVRTLPSLSSSTRARGLRTVCGVTGLSLLWYGTDQVSIVGLILMVLGLASVVLAATASGLFTSPEDSRTVQSR